MTQSVPLLSSLFYHWIVSSFVEDHFGGVSLEMWLLKFVTWGWKLLICQLFACFLQVKVRWRWWGRFWWIVRRPSTGRRKRPRNGDARRNAPVPVCSPPPLTVNEGICILNIQIVFHLWKEPHSTFACRMFQSCTGWLVNFWVKVPTLRSKRASTSGPMWNMLLR